MFIFQIVLLYFLVNNLFITFYKSIKSFYVNKLNFKFISFPFNIYSMLWSLKNVISVSLTSLVSSMEIFYLSILIY